MIAPDQIGFCKSSKPIRYQFTFQQLARNTHALLESLGVGNAIVMGHSTGGMLAIRYALMYPQQTQQLVLVDPIGLEDWKAKGRPVDFRRPVVRARTEDERPTGFAATSSRLITRGSGSRRMKRGCRCWRGCIGEAGKKEVAWNSALLYDMIYTQPVVYELGELQMPTLLLIGDKDTTAIGKDLASPEARAKLGNYPELGKLTAKAIPHATLVEFPTLGHAPQLAGSGRVSQGVARVADDGFFVESVKRVLTHSATSFRCRSPRSLGFGAYTQFARRHTRIHREQRSKVPSGCWMPVNDDRYAFPRSKRLARCLHSLRCRI